MPSIIRIAISIAIVTQLSLARAETVLCTPIVPPVTITSSGVYCLMADYALNVRDRAAIQVDANDVVIDFNSHRLGNGQAGGRQGVGVWAQNRRNISVRNGTIRAFKNGISITGMLSRGNVVENMLLEKIASGAIKVDGTANAIRGNRVVETGVIDVASDQKVFGISAIGDGGNVSDNVVFDTMDANTPVAIEVGGAGVIVVGNIVSGVRSRSSRAVGIGTAGPALVRGNIVVNGNPTGDVWEGIDDYWTADGNWSEARVQQDNYVKSIGGKM